MNRYKKPGAKRGKKKPDWKKRLKIAGIGIAVIAVIVAVPWAVGRIYMKTTRLPVFSVAEISVSGLKHVSRDNLLSYMGDPTGESIFAVDMGGLVSRLSVHPWVKAASVKRELPGRVMLDVTERAPSAVALARSGRYLVDDEGAVLAGPAGPEWDYLPSVVYEKARAPIPAGSGAEEDIADSLSLLYAVLGESSETLAGAVVHVGRDGSPYIMLDGAVVSVGREGYEDKVRKLAEIFRDVRKRGVRPRTIDLRFPGKVIVDGGAPAAGRATDNS